MNKYAEIVLVLCDHIEKDISLRRCILMQTRMQKCQDYTIIVNL